MQFMFSYPEAHGLAADMLAPGQPAELGHVAEECGWDGFALTEHPAPGARWLEAGGHQTLDPFVALAAVAAVTSRIRLLTYLAVLAYRNPLLLAKAAATLDIISAGRAVLGAGTGYLRGEFRALGASFEERNALFDEALDVLPLHWSGQPFDYQGRHFAAQGTVALPRPVQQPVPVWVGGNSATARRRAARTQGWIPVLGTGELITTIRTTELATVSDLAAAITQLHADAGPRAAPLDIGLSYPAASALHDPGTDPGPHRAAVSELAAAGVSWLIIPGPEGATRAEATAFLERLSRDYFG